MDKNDLIKHLSLVEHIEGGYFRETYRSSIKIVTDRSGEKRSVLTSIYYLLTSDRRIDHFHQNQSDIMHYFQAGSSITYLLLSPSGELTRVKLGLNLAQGEVLQLLVPSGFWKAAELEAGEFGLLGESVSPGFDYRDMKLGTASYFQATFPDIFPELIPYIK